MSLAEQVGVLILTYNEAPNIESTLSKLGWAKRILIIDSGSTDATIEIARRLPQVEVIHRPFDDFASQCNFGLEQIRTPWVLSLDADYELGDELISELHELKPAPTTTGYKARFVYCVYGKPLRGTLYPPRVVLYRTLGARYQNEGHCHRVEVSGEVRSLAAPIYHDDRKPLARWFQSQQLYARQEAAHLLSVAPAKLSVADRMRLAAGPAPFLVFFYTLLGKRCLFDGWAGWYYALQRLIAEVMLALAILDRRIRTPSTPTVDPSRTALDSVSSNGSNASLP